MTGPGRDVPPDAVRSAESHQSDDVDVLAVHGQALREAQEPGEGMEPGPWWFWAAAVLALVFGGFYLGRYSGVFTGAAAVHAPETPQLPGAGASGGTASAGNSGAIAVAGAPVPGAPGGAAPVDGASVFSNRCAACHQATGLGLPGAFPPLAGSEYVLGEEERVVRIVLRGLMGPVTVKGQPFNGAMPAWADQLSDAEIAAVLTYVRSSWGNSAEAIAVEKVARERAATSGRTAPWTAGELGR
jgi:mono/diheme cytochrome c family protein